MNHLQGLPGLLLDVLLVLLRFRNNDVVQHVVQSLVLVHVLSNQFLHFNRPHVRSKEFQTHGFLKLIVLDQEHFVTRNQHY